MKSFNPIAIAAGLCAVIIVIAYGVLDIARGSGADTATLESGQTATGNFLNCPGGDQVQAAYAEMGDEFVVVGTLASHEPDSLLVRGPLSYIRMELADGAVIQGPYVSGEIVRVSGNLADDGSAQATEFRPACSGDVVAAATPVPAVIVEPSTTPAPAVVEAMPASVPAEDQPDTVGRGKNKNGHGRNKH